MCESRLSRCLSVCNGDGFEVVAAGIDGVEDRDVGGVDVAVDGVVGCWCCIVAVLVGVVAFGWVPVPDEDVDVELGRAVLLVELANVFIAKLLVDVVVGMMCSRQDSTTVATSREA